MLVVLLFGLIIVKMVMGMRRVRANHMVKERVDKTVTRDSMRK